MPGGRDGAAESSVAPEGQRSGLLEPGPELSQAFLERGLLHRPVLVRELQLERGSGRGVDAGRRVRAPPWPAPRSSRGRSAARRARATAVASSSSSSTQRQARPTRGVLAGERLAEDDQRGGGLPSHEPLHPPEVATPGVDAEIHEPRVEARLRRGQDDVAGEGQVDPGADHRPVHRRHRRDRQPGEGEETGVHLPQRRPRCEEVVDRSTGAEGRGVAVSTSAPTPGSAAASSTVAAKLGGHLERERVAPLWVVEHDHGDVAVPLEANAGLLGVHGSCVVPAGPPMAGQNDAMPYLPSDSVTRIKARLDHPVIDADGHAVEYLPVVRDILRAQAGDAAVDALERMTSAGSTIRDLTPEQRRAAGHLPHDVVGPAHPQHPRPRDGHAPDAARRAPRRARHRPRRPVPDLRPDRHPAGRRRHAPAPSPARSTPSTPRSTPTSPTSSPRSASSRCTTPTRRSPSSSSRRRSSG